MRANYKEQSATQAAARLLGHQKGTMNVLKLIKLLYLVDREALIRFGRPVTFDTFVAMPHGPVLSLTLDRINHEQAPGRTSYWRRYISERQQHHVKLIANPGTGELSRAEEELIDEVFSTYGHMDQWQLRDWCHENLAEWQNPAGSALTISISDMLRAAGFSDEDAREVEQALQGEAELEQLAQ